MGLRPLRILCLGDSLTAGYTEFGMVHHPYHTALVKKLKAAFPELEIEVDEDGMDGDFTKNFSPRLTAAFRMKRSMKPYDWTIVLGGTNDLSLAMEPDQIFEYLERTYSNAIRRRSKVLALTVPEVGTVIKSPRILSLNARRDQLNEKIQGYNCKDFYSFDFKSAFSFAAMSDEDRKRYWDDGIHLTPDGYDLMGDRVGAALADILHRDADAREHAQTGAVGTSGRPTRRKRKFKDDEVDFDEETSDPGDMRRGYVVVRWKDLV